MQTPSAKFGAHANKIGKEYKVSATELVDTAKLHAATGLLLTLGLVLSHTV